MEIKRGIAPTREQQRVEGRRDQSIHDSERFEPGSRYPRRQNNRPVQGLTDKTAPKNLARLNALLGTNFVPPEEE